VEATIWASVAVVLEVLQHTVVGWPNGIGECQRRRRELGFGDFRADEGGGVGRGGLLGSALSKQREKGEEWGGVRTECS
jgi:hypothetical protein